MYVKLLVKFVAIAFIIVAAGCSSDPGFVGKWDYVKYSSGWKTLVISKEGKNTFIIFEDLRQGSNFDKTYRAELKDGMLVVDVPYGSLFARLLNNKTMLEFDNEKYRKIQEDK